MKRCNRISSPAAMSPNTSWGFARFRGIRRRQTHHYLAVNPPTHTPNLCNKHNTILHYYRHWYRIVVISLSNKLIDTMLTFKLQRQTVVTLVGLSFLCMVPMVSALGVRTSTRPVSWAPSKSGKASKIRVCYLKFHFLPKCPLFCSSLNSQLQDIIDYWNSCNIFYKFMIGAPIIFIIAGITGLE